MKGCKDFIMAGVPSRHTRNVIFFPSFKCLVSKESSRQGKAQTLSFNKKGSLGATDNWALKAVMYSALCPWLKQFSMNFSPFTEHSFYSRFFTGLPLCCQRLPVTMVTCSLHFQKHWNEFQLKSTMDLFFRCWCHEYIYIYIGVYILSFSEAVLMGFKTPQGYKY